MRLTLAAAAQCTAMFFFGMQAMYMLYDLPAVALRANAFSRCSKMRRTVCLVCRVFD